MVSIFETIELIDKIGAEATARGEEGVPEDVTSRDVEEQPQLHTN